MPLFDWESNGNDVAATAKQGEKKDVTIENGYLHSINLKMKMIKYPLKWNIFNPKMKQIIRKVCRGKNGIQKINYVWKKH